MHPTCNCIHIVCLLATAYVPPSTVQRVLRDPTSMDLCDTNLSWDGSLCNRCRQIFDSHIVEFAHELGLCYGDELTASMTLTYEYRLWWHSISSLKRCATRSCKLCELALFFVRDADLERLERWQATLPAIIVLKEKGPHLFGVLMPEADPRPEVLESRNYNRFVVTVIIQDNLDLESLRPRRISSISTASDETFGKINAWLRSCKSHKTCTHGSAMSRQYIDIRPTRLLELARSDGQPSVKLVETAQIDFQKVSYATLSHCWGKTLTAKLLRHFIKDYSTQIPWEGLPRTFQDAITASLRLDIFYLWIDALCIVQDDRDDWNLEAPRMAGVYSNSYLNFAADASRDSTEGLFRQRNPNDPQSFIVPHWKSDLHRCGSVFWLDRWDDCVNNSPLAGRAWTVQERFLAPRVLHFAEDVHWECMELVTAESVPVLFHTGSGHNYLVSKSALNVDELPAREKMRKLYGTWNELVLAYSKVALTFTSDRPIAIAGLAYSFCHLLGLSESDYLCGMWRPQLQHEMMWFRRSSPLSVPQPPRLSHLPSWSWLSFCTRVWIFPRPFDKKVNLDDLMT